MLVEFLNLDGKHSYKEVDDQKIEEVKSHGDEGFLLKDQKYYKFNHMIEEKIAVFKEIDLFTIKVARARVRIALAKNTLKSSKTILAQSLDPNEVRRNALKTFQAKLEGLNNTLEQYKTSYDPKTSWQEFKKLAMSSYQDIEASAKMLDLKDLDLNSIHHYFYVIHKDSQGKSQQEINRNLDKMQPLVKGVAREVAEQLALLPKVKKEMQEAPQRGIPRGVPRHHAPRPKEDSIKHPVAKGENLSVIAKRYQKQYPWLTWADIFVMNSEGKGANLKDPDLMYAGAVLDIPTSPLADPKLLEAKKAIIAKQSAKWKQKLEEKKKSKEAPKAPEEKADLSKLDVGSKYKSGPTEAPQFQGQPAPTPAAQPKTLSQENQDAISDAASWWKK